MNKHHLSFAVTIAIAALLPVSNAQILVGTAAFTFGSQGNEEGQFNAPRGVAFDSNGTLYVNDALNYRIQKLTPTGGFVGSWGTQGTGNGQMDAPLDLCIDRDNQVFVLDTYNHRVQKFNTNGTFIMKWGTSGSGAGQFNTPRCIANDDAGNIYVADTWNNRIQKFTGDGVFVRSFGGYGTAEGKMIAPVGIVLDAAGDVYVADQGNYRIQKFTSGGTFITKWGSRGSAVGQFQSSLNADGGPNDMVMDMAGNIVVIDGGNNRIQVFTSAGRFITQFGSFGTALGKMDRPGRVTFNNDSSLLYVTDIGNVRIQAFTYTVPPPMFLSTPFNATGGVFTWSSIPGAYYQLQAKSKMEDEWGDYGVAVTAGGQTTSMVIEMGTSPDQFFRAARVPSLGPTPGL
jgi:tripartite motif-containing protein 71